MKSTDCLGLPYPECAPPLVRDASDINQFRDLALATDAAVQVLADSVTTTLLSPPVCIVDSGNTVVGRDIIQPVNGIPYYDNAGIHDNLADVLVVPEDGWYLLGGYVRAIPAAGSNIGLRVEPIINGSPVSALQGPGRSHLASDSLNWNDMLFLRAGDQATCHTRHSASTALSVGYTMYFWLYQVITNV